MVIFMYWSGTDRNQVPFAASAARSPCHKFRSTYTVTVHESFCSGKRFDNRIETPGQEINKPENQQFCIAHLRPRVLS